MTHTCNVCGVTSDAAEFYTGLKSRCKECHKRLVKENRKEKEEYYKKYDAERFQNDPRVRDRHRKYRKTEKGKASMAAAREKWLQDNSDKKAAHTILNNAVRDGRVQKPKVCSSCGVSGRIEGHHEDYTKPLDVVWLCRSCHVRTHREKI